jgi:DNA-binding NarL/FixJ family response regulator
MTLGTLMRGRDHELGLVLDMIRAAEAGRGGVLLVEGEPGIGKSHLLKESTDLVRRVVIEDTPVTARQALHRQAGEFLLEHGAPPAAATAHLISGSRLCDPRALARLDHAARTLLAAVSGLVAQGLTNQQVAAEMFLSTHTVAFHLRQIYRKLDIGSRVDLARILTERSYAADSPQAS